MAEFLGVFAEFFLGVVRQQGGQFSAACGHGANGKAKQSAAQPGFPGAAPVLGAEPQAACDFHHFAGLGFFALPGQVKRFAHGKQTDGGNGDFNTIEQFVLAEGKARLAGLQIQSDQAKQQAGRQAGNAAQHRVAQHG